MTHEQYLVMRRDWLRKLADHCDDMQSLLRTEKVRTKRWYLKLDTDHLWVVPFSLIAMGILTLLLVPPVLAVWVYGWALFVAVRYDGASFWLWLAYRWTARNFNLILVLITALALWSILRTFEW